MSENENNMTIEAKASLNTAAGRGDSSNRTPQNHKQNKPPRATTRMTGHSDDDIDQIITRTEEALAEKNAGNTARKDNKAKATAGKIDDDFGDVSQDELSFDDLQTTFVRGQKRKAGLYADDDDLEPENIAQKKRRRAAIQAAYEDAAQDKKQTPATIETGKDIKLPGYNRGFRESFIVRDYAPLDLLTLSYPKRMTEKDKKRIKKYLKKAMLHGMLNKGWTTFYFENAKGQIDPAMTGLAQEALQEMQQGLQFRFDRREEGKRFGITEREEALFNHLKNITISNKPKPGIQLHQAINPNAYTEQLRQLWTERAKPVLKTQITDPANKFIDDHGRDAGRSIKRKVWSLTD